MYAALWRVLPGPFVVRLALLIGLVALVVWALFTWFFPMVQSWLPYDETTVEPAAAYALSSLDSPLHEVLR